MPSGSVFGSPLSLKESLMGVAVQLAEWFDPQPVRDSSLRLLAVADGLPDITLSYQRDRRLFSRTLQLVIEAQVAGSGPSGNATLAVRARRLRRRLDLEWGIAPPPGEGGTLARFVRAGLSAGARTMTNVRQLVVSWSAAESIWRLRLVTLAGAVIGTAPGAAISVPLEPDDVKGLLAVLRAFRDAAEQ
jgi:hypothetical protein